MVPCAEPTTGRAFVEQVSQQLNRSTSMLAVSPRLVRPLGLVSTVVRFGTEMLYQFEQPFIVDSSKFSRTATPYTEGIAETVKWYEKNPARSLLPSG